MKKFTKHFILLYSIFALTTESIRAQSQNKIQLVPTISIVSSDGTYGESVGALCFSVSISNPETDTTFVDVLVVASSTGSVGGDFSLTPTTIKFLPNFTGSEYVCVSVVNDAVAEPIEIYSLKLSNASNGAVINDSLINFTIYDDDSVSTNSPCTDLFFSEFVHSFTAGDRAIEIYNPIGQVANLSQYSLKIYFNGDTTPGTTIPLSGFLNYADTYVMSYSGSDSIVRSLSDSVSGQFFFNSANAIALYHGATLIDCYGIIGVDPGNYWPVGGSSTSSATIVRKQSIKQGESSWAISNGQWDVFPQADYTHLGAHTINGCGFVIPPTVTMFTSDVSYSESVGTLTISARIFNPSSSPITVDVVVGSLTTATNNIDFGYTPTQLTFPANSTADQYISISLFDELSIEPDEIIELRLQNASNGASILDSSWMMTIVNDDFTGIRTVKAANNLLLHPNPVKNVLHVSNQLPIEEYNISNFLGQVILQSSKLSANQLKINTQELEAGIYFIQIKSEGKYLSGRFIKE